MFNTIFVGHALLNHRLLKVVFRVEQLLCPRKKTWEYDLCFRAFSGKHIPEM